MKYVKTLVTILTVTMTLGFLTIVALFVMRFGNISHTELPESITLPSGAVATAFTRGQGWFAVVTEADEILIYNQATGKLRQRISIEPE